MSLCCLRGQCCIFKRIILSNRLPVFFFRWLFYCSKFSFRNALTCVCSLILAFSAQEEGVIFFLFLQSLLFVLVSLLSAIIFAFFVSYFIERCSFAILVRKKTIKLIHADMSIYTCCVLLYHSPVLQKHENDSTPKFQKRQKHAKI